MDTTWDCIVIGGGAAGLSAALVLGRARRTTLIIDAGAPSNGPAHGIGGLLGHDGRPPAELYARGRAELTAYPSVTLRAGEAVDARRDDAGHHVLHLADGSTETTRRVLLATGMTYRHPDLDGVAARWGRSVFHCPFCHGWEVRDRPLGVLDDGPTAMHRATLLRGWSHDVTLYTNGPTTLTADEVGRLTGAGIAVVETPVARVDGPGTDLDVVVLADGTTRPCGGLLVASPLEPRSPLAERLGVATAATPMSPASVVVGATAATNVDGVFAAGDVTPHRPSVANAIAAGSNAAADIVFSLLEAELAVAGPR